MTRRGIIIAAAVVLLIVLCVGGMYRLLQQVRYALGGEDDLTVKQALVIARNGDRLVKAVYAYKQMRGLWPQRLQDMVADFLDNTPTDPLRYYWYYGGAWFVGTPSRYPWNHVEYRLGPDGRAWVLVYPEDNDVVLPIRQDIPRPPNITREDLERNTIDEFHRRIGREPKELLHQQGLISFLVRRGRISEAQELCLRLSERLPTHWWPEAMVAHLGVRQGRAQEAEARLRTWTSLNAGFLGYYYLADFYHGVEHHGDACSALHSAIQYTLRPDELEQCRFVFDAYLYQAACYAYSHEQFKLVLEICDRWEQFERQQGYAEQSYHAIRAAAWLALGELEKVRTNGAKAARASWAGDTAMLRKAVSSGLTDFRLRLTPFPESLLVDYE